MNETIKTSDGVFVGCHLGPSGPYGEEPRMIDENGNYVTGKTEDGIYLHGRYTSNIAIQQLIYECNSDPTDDLLEPEDIIP